jgi:hypothetical protein
MTWALTDRITRINFYAALVAAGVALWPLLAGQTSLILMAAVLMLVYQAWRLAMARQVRGSVSEVSITKAIGNRSCQLPWSEVRAARLARFLGTDQVIVTTTVPIAWNASDRWYGRLGGHEIALQIPSDCVPRLRELFGANGVPLA